MIALIELGCFSWFSNNARYGSTLASSMKARRFLDAPLICKYPTQRNRMMMCKRLAIVAGVTATFFFCGHQTALALSRVEADVIVAAEMASESDRDLARQSQLKEIPALQETRFERNGRTTHVRRVAPPPSPQPETAEVVSKEGAGSSVRPIDHRPRKNLTLFITVFNETMTEVKSPEHETFAAIFESDLGDLPAVVDIETAEVNYSFFSIIQDIDAETATPGSRSWAFRPSGASEYAIHSKTGDPAPAAFLEAIGLLHDHYLEHKARFAADAHRGSRLRRPGNDT